MTALVVTNNDLAIVGNNFSLTQNESDEEIRQRLIQNLQTFLGEWFLDTSIGVPYLQLIFRKAVPTILIESAFKDMITATRGVIALLRFDPLDLDSENRTLRVNFSVRTLNSAIDLALEIP